MDGQEEILYEDVASMRYVPNYSTWLMLLTILGFIGVFIWHENHLFNREYYSCAQRYQINIDFSGHAICTDPQRDRFEREGRLDCTGAEKYTYAEPPFWCAFRCWLPQSSLGHAAQFVQHIYGKTTGWMGISVIVFIVLIVIYLVISEKATTKRHTLSLAHERDLVNASLSQAVKMHQATAALPDPAAYSGVRIRDMSPMVKTIQ